MITIYWMTHSRRQLPEGGDEANHSFEELLIEGHPTEGYTVSAEATEHAIERAANVADHVVPQARELELECVVPRHIWDERIEFDPDHSNTTIQQVDELILGGIPVDIETQRGTFENFLLLSRSEERTIDTGDAARFTLSARELFIADLEEVAAPSPRVERARPRTDRGNQGAAPAAPVTADPANLQSAARSIYEQLAGARSSR